MLTRDLKWHAGRVSKAHRKRLLGQRGAVIWFTGLSGSGKSTLAYALEYRLVCQRRSAYVLDGDNVRHGLNADLGFEPAHRHENLRRIGEVAALFADAGTIAIVSFISPYRQARERARACTDGPFVEVYLDVPLSVCERRDPKGFYRQARMGEIPNFTGIDAPYQAPVTPELCLDTDALGVDACVDRILTYLEHGLVFSGIRRPSRAREAYSDRA